MKKLQFVRPTGLREHIFTTFMLEMKNPISAEEEIELCDLEEKSYGVAKVLSVDTIPLYSIPALFLEECQDRRCITMSGLAQTMAAHYAPQETITIQTKIICVRMQYLRDSIVEVAKKVIVP